MPDAHLPLPESLAARHGGSRATWSQRLRLAGLPLHVTEAQLTPSQRAELKRLLALRPQPTVALAVQAPDNLRDWARQCLRRHLDAWQPWALAPPLAVASVRLSSRQQWLHHGPAAPQGPPPPLPTDDAFWGERLRDPRLQACRPHELRVLALLHAAVRHPEVAGVLDRLAPGVRGRGWSLRLLARVACPEHAGRVTLPPALVRRDRARGLEVVRLQPPEPSRPRGKVPPAGEAPVPGLLTRLSPLPADVIALQLAEHTEQSLHDLRMRWQLRGRVGVAGGVVGLLAGEPGHGKRTAARLLAQAVGAELYRVQPGLLASRWIGETEQRISRLFADVQASGGALLIEDAQDLMAQRVEVHGANDRYSNVAANHLLQEVERFQGLLLLLAPSPALLDTAMRRRVQVVVRFDAPDRPRRAAILRAAWRWLLPRVRTQPPELEPEWLELAATALTPADLVHAVFDAGLEVTLRAAPLDHDALARALRLRATARRDVAVAWLGGEA